MQYDEITLTPPRGRTMIILGKIIDTPAVTDDEGNVVTPTTYKSGWHVDAPYPVPELEPYRVEPQSPRHTYAGATTYHYRFTDEAEFEAFKAQHTDEDDNWQLTPPKPKPPKQVTRRQFIQQLIYAGIRTQVEAALDQIQDDTQREIMKAWYLESQVFEIDRPELNQMIETLGFTEEYRDEFFRQASKL